MIRTAAAWLASRVAWRIVALFIGAALLPLALMAALALSHVRAAQLAQGEQRLAARAKSYGLEVMARLQDASDLLDQSIRFDVDAPISSPASQTFRSLVVARATAAQPDGTGHPAAPTTLTDAERQRLARGQKALVARTTTNGDQSVALAVPVDTPRGRFVAFAELNPRFLWGDTDLFPHAMDFCVIEWGSLRPLRCAGAMPTALLSTADRKPGSPDAGTLAWETGGERLRSAAWGLFLAHEFGADDWIIVATQPEAEMLRPVEAFRRSFVPVVLLTLFVVAWLSLRLINSTLTPLVELTQATRRIAARDFNARVATGRNDEFGELACAFNSMTDRLENQFAALAAMAEIDREILSSHDLERVALTTLRHLRHLVAAEAIGVMLVDSHNGSLSMTYIDRRVGPPDHAAVRAALGKEDAALLLGSPEGTWFPAAGRQPEYVLAVAASTDGATYAHPLEWRGALCGALIFAMEGAGALSAEEQVQIREAAARLAVAVSAAWREAQIYRQAHFDSLTELPNRSLFRDRIAQEIERCRRDRTGLCLLFVDLDNFKRVNDTIGHSHGDAVLAEAARRLVGCVRASDTVARLGGDEFAIMIRHGAHHAEIGRVVQLALLSMALPFEIQGTQSFLGASIGIATYPTDGTGAEELLRNADTAMYKAKAAGRGQAVYFQEAMNHEAREFATLERDLHSAIAGGQFVLHYQPQLDLRHGTIVGVEALIRWQHPTRGMVSPAQFIPVAEQSGLIEEIGLWSLREACGQLRAMHARGIALGRIAVNVSIRQLYDPAIVDVVRRTLAEFDCEPAGLELEITESMLAERVTEVRDTLEQLKAIGVGLALDDFGTGYASLSYLKDLPVEVLKIDRSFVSGLPFNGEAIAIVRAMIAMGHALDKRVVAEGIETEEQLGMLRAMGCDLAQGYFIGRPIAAPELECKLMRSQVAELAPDSVEEIAA